MFNLVAVLFLAANPAEPIGAMTYNQETFSSEQVCTAFMDSDVGKVATGKIEKAARSQGVAVKFACVEAKDNTI